MKSKGGLGNCHSQKGPEEARGLNVMWNLGWEQDIGSKTRGME